MSSNDTQLYAMHFYNSVDLPVERARGNKTDGIGIAHVKGEVIISINYQGYAYFITLAGEDIDAVAHQMAAAMSKATRAAHPSLESRQ